jgi:hypothetical protein
MPPAGRALRRYRGILGRAVGLENASALVAQNRGAMRRRRDICSSASCRRTDGYATRMCGCDSLSLRTILSAGSPASSRSVGSIRVVR